MEIASIFLFFCLVFAPYAFFSHKEQVKLAKKEIALQRKYGTSPWTDTGTYTHAPAYTSENLDLSGGSAWFSDSEPPSEPVFEPLVQKAEPVHVNSEPVPEPLPEPLVQLIENGFEKITYPTEILDHPNLPAFISLILFLRAVKEMSSENVSFNSICQQLGIPKGGSKKYKLVHLIWTHLE